MFWIQGTESLIKIAILFFRERYIDGGEEPLIATVEGDTDPVGKGIFEKLSKRKKSWITTRLKAEQRSGVKVVSASQAGTRHNK